MGGTESRLSKDYSIDAPKPLKKTKIGQWDLQNAISNSSKEKFSIFTFKATTEEEIKWIQPILTSTQKAKTVRHPLIVRYIDVFTTGTSVSIVTERVTSLAEVLQSAELTPENLILGLSNVLTALDFLHTKCRLLHNSVSLPALFISEKDEAWKLGGLEFCLPMESWGTEIFNSLPAILLDELNPPQMPQPASSSVKAHSRDIWAFGTLLSSLASRVNTEGNHDFAISLPTLVNELCNPTSANRPSPAQVKGSPLFKNSPLLKLTAGIDSFRIQSPQAKEELLKSLPAQLKAVGQSSLVKYIVPKLLDVTMFVEPSIPALYSVLFKPKERQGILEEPHFSELVVPFILQMYQKPLKEVRLVLLDLIDCYISSVTMEDIYAAIMPQLSKAIEESDDELWVKNFCAISSIYVLVIQSEEKEKEAKKSANLSANAADSSSFSSEVLETVLLPYFCDIMRSSAPAELKDLACLFLLRLWALGYDKGPTFSVLKHPHYIPRTVTILLKELEVPIRANFISKILLSHLSEFSVTFCVRGLMALLLPFLLDPNEQIRNVTQIALHSITDFLNGFPDEAFPVQKFGTPQSLGKERKPLLEKQRRNSVPQELSSPSTPSGTLSRNSSSNSMSGAEMERSKKEPSSQASRPQGIIPVSPVVVTPPKPAIIEKQQTHAVKDSWDDVGFEAEASNEWDADGWDNPSQEAPKELPAGKSSSVQPLNGHGDDDGWESFEENAEMKKEEVAPEPSLSTELEDSEFLEKQLKIAQEEIARANAEELKKQQQQEALKAKREARRLEMEAKRLQKKQPTTTTPSDSQEPQEGGGEEENHSSASLTTSPILKKGSVEPSTEASVAKTAPTPAGKTLSLKAKTVITNPTPTPASTPAVTPPTPSTSTSTSAPETPQEPERDAEADMLSLLDDEPPKAAKKAPPKASLAKKPSVKKLGAKGGKSAVSPKSPLEGEATPEKNAPTSAHSTQKSKAEEQEEEQKEIERVPEKSGLEQKEIEKVQEQQEIEKVPEKEQQEVEKVLPVALAAAAIGLGADGGNGGGWDDDNENFHDDNESFHDAKDDDTLGSENVGEKSFFDMSLSQQEDNLAKMIKEELGNEKLSLERAKAGNAGEWEEEKPLEDTMEIDPDHPNDAWGDDY